MGEKKITKKECDGDGWYGGTVDGQTTCEQHKKNDTRLAPVGMKKVVSKKKSIWQRSKWELLRTVLVASVAPDVISLILIVGSGK